ncbi:hypothetical protein [Kribbella sp. NPDC050459]
MSSCNTPATRRVLIVITYDTGSDILPAIEAGATTATLDLIRR